MGKLGIDRSKSVADKHDRRSVEACPRESVRNLQNHNGGGSNSEETEDESKNMADAENGVVCDVEHNGADA